MLLDFDKRGPLPNFFFFSIAQNLFGLHRARGSSGLTVGWAGPDPGQGEASEALAASGPQFCCMHSAASCSSTGLQQTNETYPMMLTLFDVFQDFLAGNKRSSEVA